MSTVCEHILAQIKEWWWMQIGKLLLLNNYQAEPLLCRILIQPLPTRHVAILKAVYLNIKYSHWLYTKLAYVPYFIDETYDCTKHNNKIMIKKGSCITNKSFNCFF